MKIKFQAREQNSIIQLKLKKKKNKYKNENEKQPKIHNIIIINGINTKIIMNPNAQLKCHFEICVVEFFVFFFFLLLVAFILPFVFECRAPGEWIVDFLLVFIIIIIME